MPTRVVPSSFEAQLVHTTQAVHGLMKERKFQGKCCPDTSLDHLHPSNTQCSLPCNILLLCYHFESCMILYVSILETMSPHIYPPYINCHSIHAQANALPTMLWHQHS